MKYNKKEDPYKIYNKLHKIYDTLYEEVDKLEESD